MKKTASWSLFAIGVLGSAVPSCGGDPGEMGEGTTDSVAQALVAAPPAVAGGLVRTPFGSRPAACVHAVPEGALIRGGQVIASGAVVKSLPGCKGLTPPDVNGYVENVVGYSTGTPATGRGGDSNSATFFTSFTDRFKVPAKPTKNVGQLIYFFPAMEPTDGAAIIQPVLQYGSNGSFGGTFWTIASWYLDSDGNVTHSPPVTVNAGDSLIGSMVSIACAPDDPNAVFDSFGNCSWTIKMSDTTASKTTTLRVDAFDTFAYAMKGAMEVYGVSACNQLPAATVVDFNTTKIMERTSTGIVDVTSSVAWFPVVTPGLTPACGYAAQNTSATVADLKFHN